MNSSGKKTGKGRGAGKPIVLPSAFAPRSTAAETLLSPDQAAQIQQLADLLKENMIAKILIYEHRPITVLLPNFIELKVVDGEPGVRGDTASGGNKPVIVETGATIKVPLYLEIGETIRIDTRTREFVERVR